MDVNAEASQRTDEMSPLLFTPFLQPFAYFMASIGHVSDPHQLTCDLQWEIRLHSVLPLPLSRVP